MPPPPLDFLSSPSITRAPADHSSPSALATPGTRPTRSTRRSFERPREAELAREGLPRAQFHVDSAVGGVLEVLEARPDLVGEHVGAGDHRHAQQDRDGRQRRAQLALDEPAQDRPPIMRRVPSGGRGSAPGTGGPGGPTICPSARNRTESAMAAAPASCVTITIVWPKSSTARRSSASTSRLAFESRLPVGSSANTTAGCVISARATATRCAWPPDSSLGRCLRRSPRPDRLDQRLEPVAVRLVAADPDREHDVLLRVEDRQEVVALEDEPHLAAAKQGQMPVVQRRPDGCRRSRPSRLWACRARPGCA